MIIIIVPIIIIIIIIINRRRHQSSQPPSIPIHTTPQAYLERMKGWGDRDQWGGAAELAVLAHISNRRIFLVERLPDEGWQLLIGPIGPTAKPNTLKLCLAFTGAHYDAVKLPPHAWNLLQGLP